MSPPVTLPVLTEEHAETLARTVSNLRMDSEDFETLAEILTNVDALIPGGTHELQERVSGDTVRVPRVELKSCLSDNATTRQLQHAIRRWLSGDKP